jgi:hypothetical protein
LHSIKIANPELPAAPQRLLRGELARPQPTPSSRRSAMANVSNERRAGRGALALVTLVHEGRLPLRALLH